LAISLSLPLGVFSPPQGSLSHMDLHLSSLRVSHKAVTLPLISWRATAFVDSAKERVDSAPKHRWDAADLVIDEEDIDTEVLCHVMDLHQDLVLY
jgi:hypothetical protein